MSETGNEENATTTMNEPSDLHSPTPGSVPVAILLPTLNEEEGLARTLDDIPVDHLRSAGFDPTFVVVDGHSTDRTLEVARRYGATILVQTSKGKGGATREGLAWAQAHGMRYAVLIDADFTYPGTGIASLLSLLEAGSDLVIGVRRPEFNPLGVVRAAIHRLGDGLLNYIAAQLSHSPILDICSGLWGIRTSVVEGLELESTGFEIEAEVFLKSFRSGLRVSQIPISYRNRVGVAKLHAVQDGAKILLGIVRHSGAAQIRADPLRSHRQAPRQPLRDLQAICLATDAHDLVIFSPLARVAEANDLSRRLSAGKIGVKITIIPYDPLKQSVVGPPSPLPLAAAVSIDGRVPIVVSLPGESSDSDPMSVAVVGLPNSRRLVCVPIGADQFGDDPFALPEHMTRSGGYQLEPAARARFRSLSILTSSFNGSVQQKELALLRANADSLRVYRETARGETSSSVVPTGVESSA
ncbi:MAG: glycosyltransferase family 2 protein [Thermoplasmata archaeon]|nr:glycosyltransferase family 2 protein [Thermoplasmata archaeon]